MMFKQQYKKEMDQVKLSDIQMEQLWDKLEATKAAPWRKGLRTALVAAALCAALLISAVAMSPSLREAMMEALGNLAPYSQRVEGVTCVANGIEVKVVSAVADSAMVRVYAEVRDLTGNRIRANTGAWSVINRSDPDNKGFTNTTATKLVSYDAETKTALWEFDGWGTVTSSLTDVELKILNMYTVENNHRNSILGKGSEDWVIPLNIEKIPEREIPLTGVVGAQTLRKMMVSPLGVTVHWTYGPGAVLSTFPFAVKLTDGTWLKPEHGGRGGDMWIDNDDPIERDCWTFTDPATGDKIAGIAFGYWYTPIDGDTAGEGYWLKEMP